MHASSPTAKTAIRAIINTFFIFIVSSPFQTYGSYVYILLPSYRRCKRYIHILRKFGFFDSTSFNCQLLASILGKEYNYLYFKVIYFAASFNWRVCCPLFCLVATYAPAATAAIMMIPFATNCHSDCSRMISMPFAMEPSNIAPINVPQMLP